MKSLRSHKKCSQVEISNLNDNSFCSVFSIHSRTLNFFIDEEELEPILLTNFQEKVQNLFHTLLGVIFIVLVFVVIFDLVTKHNAYYPHQPLL